MYQHDVAFLNKSVKKSCNEAVRARLFVSNKDFKTSFTYLTSPHIEVCTKCKKRFAYYGKLYAPLGRQCYVYLMLFLTLKGS